jgi:hypothetical protein
MQADAETAELCAALGTIERLASAAIARGEAGTVPERQLAGAFAALARLSAARAEQEASALPVARDALTATETVTVVSGLLRAADLNVFDLAMWFRRPA